MYFCSPMAPKNYCNTSEFSELNWLLSWWTVSLCLDPGLLMGRAKTVLLDSLGLLVIHGRQSLNTNRRGEKLLTFNMTGPIMFVV